MTPNEDPTVISSAAELLAAYAAGERDFAYRIRLPWSASLYGADLTGANLEHADLTGANLEHADLAGANLEGADLTDADLEHADLTGANLEGADLWGANLRSANLEGADLAGANLEGADLWGANLRGADLEGADLAGADLAGADLWGADLRGADLTDAKNHPASSHDVLAELLRQAAGEDVQRRAFAGLLLISRDWCWRDYQRLRDAGTWPVEIVTWASETLGAYESLAPFLRRFGWLPRETPPSLASETAAEGPTGGASC